MSARNHARHVVDQFGSQAAAYVTSAVHAAGADLDRIGAVIQARPGARVLDLGCGGGHVAFTAAAAGAVVTAYDLSEPRCWRRSPPRRLDAVSIASTPVRAPPRPCPSRTRPSTRS